MMKVLPIKQNVLLFWVLQFILQFCNVIDILIDRPIHPPVLGNPLQKGLQPASLTLTVGVHEDQHLPSCSASPEGPAPCDPKAPHAADQTHAAQVGHILAEHALQVSCGDVDTTRS